MKRKETLIIRSADVQIIEGVSESTARRRLQHIRAVKGKKSPNPISIKEYCEFNGFDIEEVKLLLFK